MSNFYLELSNLVLQILARTAGLVPQTTLPPAPKIVGSYIHNLNLKEWFVMCFIDLFKFTYKIRFTLFNVGSWLSTNFYSLLKRASIKRL